MRETLYDFCIRTGQQTLLQEWDAKRNAPLTPEMVTRYSNRCVWWRCEKGHSWKTPVRTRTHAACGCPYCAGRKVSRGLMICLPVCLRLQPSGTQP